MEGRDRKKLEDEFIVMIRKYERAIYKACSFYVSEDFPMEDLYQESVANLWKAFPNFRGDSSPSTWIYRVTLNTCISGLRKTKRRPQKAALQGWDLPDIEQEEPAEDRSTELYAMIRRLMTLERAIVLLWLEERPYQEIADITGLSVSNVAVKLSRAKEKLKLMSNRK